MIENVKRFANEHRTLIVVIISVLVICFLYWFLYCKDRPLENGGDIYKLALKFKNKQLSVDIECLLVNIVDKPIVVLSGSGELKYKQNDIYNKYIMFNDLCIRNESFKNTVRFPLCFFTGNHNITFYQVFGTDANNDNIYYTGDILTFDKYSDVDKTNPLINFNFTNIITNSVLSKEIQDDILKTYDNLLNFTESIMDFSHATVIGQKAFGSIKPDDVSYQSFYYSKNTRDVSDSAKQAIYNKCKNNVRSWYENQSFKDMLTKKYYSNKVSKKVKDGEVADDSNQSPDTIILKDGDNVKNYEVADIYPACKVAMTILTLMENLINAKYSNTEMYKMIAVFSLSVHLLNSFCGVRMYNDWNKHIGNEYVYKRKKINGQEEMELDQEAFDFKDIEINTNYLHEKHYSQNAIKQGIKNSDMPPDEMKTWSSAFGQVADEKLGKKQLKIKKCVIEDDWWAEARTKCEIAHKDYPDISFEDFYYYRNEVKVDDYIDIMKNGEDINEYFIICQTDGVVINKRDFLKEGLNSCDYQLMSQLNDELDDYEAYLKQITRIPDNFDYIQYNDVDITSLPVLNVVYDNSGNNRRHKFTQEERFIIYTWATNKNLLNRTDKWDIICSHAFNYDNEKKFTVRQIRDQWRNYINPNIENKDWSEQELKLLVDKYNLFGPKWDYISKFLPGKSVNNIKNKYFSIMLKCKGNLNGAISENAKNLESLQNIINIKTRIAQATSYREMLDLLKSNVGEFTDSYEPEEDEFLTDLGFVAEADLPSL